VATILALEKLYTDVEALLDDVPQSFGWREPTKRGEPNRIAWVPGDEGGLIGDVGGARYPGRVPRPIANIVERFTVSIFGQDNSDPENELAQYHATRLLFDRWLAAVYRAAHGTFAIETARWADEAKERRFGAAIVVVATVDAMVPDLEDDDTPPTALGLGADITATELGVTGTAAIDPPVFTTEFTSEFD
jgi:hypothetical protein